MDVKFKYVLDTAVTIYITEPFTLDEIIDFNGLDSLLEKIGEDFGCHDHDAFFSEEIKVLEKIQYLGLEDINGFEIYESYLLEDDSGLIFEVVKDDRKACTGFRMKLVKNDVSKRRHLKVGHCYDFLSWYFPDTTLKIIGNIHQDIHLVKRISYTEENKEK